MCRSVGAIPPRPHTRKMPEGDARSMIVIVKARPFLYMDELARELAVRCGTSYKAPLCYSGAQAVLRAQIGIIFCKRMARQSDGNTGRTQVAQLLARYRGWTRCSSSLSLAALFPFIPIALLEASASPQYPSQEVCSFAS